MLRRESEPFVILLLDNFGERQWRYLKIAFYITVPLLLTAHVFLSFDLLAGDLDIFRKEEKAMTTAAAAEGRPVVFIDSYKDAS
ncbi:MAG: hypothetical protein AAFO94_05515, partial [Bacteroidota bacterium]